jgi:hypothetical protein
LMEFMNNVMRIFVYKVTKWQVDEENCVMKRFIINMFHKKLSLSLYQRG